MLSKVIKKQFKKEQGKITIFDTSVYENEKEDWDRIFKQTKNPAIAIDLILERRFAQAKQDGKLTPKEEKRINQLLNREFKKDESNLPDKQKKKVEKIKRKLRKGEKVHRYPNLMEYFLKKDE